MCSKDRRHVIACLLNTNQYANEGAHYMNIHFCRMYVNNAIRESSVFGMVTATPRRNRHMAFMNYLDLYR